MQTTTDISWGPIFKAARGRVAIDTVSALVPGISDGSEEGRFYLFQSGGKTLTSMWTLWDRASGSQHFLFAHDWDEAKKLAASRIPGLLQPKRATKLKKAKAPPKKM